MVMADVDPVDRARYPLEPWALVEALPPGPTDGVSESLFAVSNGYIGLRGNAEDGRGGYEQGSYINGFHETWPIRHAEEAYGFARVGQTIINAPDAKILRIFVDDDPFLLDEAEIENYERRLDFTTGVLTRSLIWRTARGNRVALTTRRLVSYNDKHLALLELELTSLDRAVAVTLSSEIINRADGREVYRHTGETVVDPRQAERVAGRILDPQLARADGDELLLGYRAVSSGMTIACAVKHRFHGADAQREAEADSDAAKAIYRFEAQAGQTIRLEKAISYHTASTVPVSELAERAERTVSRASELGFSSFIAGQAAELARYWANADVTITPALGAEVETAGLQQAIRFNLFHVFQATVRTDGAGMAAKALTGSGYSGHYFWDTETYVLPVLIYTAPDLARNLLRFRELLLPAARKRAMEVNQDGALFPWRTINGQEAGAYYAAGTAQYHINADIAFALSRYLEASGDVDFLANGAIDILVETARLWNDLGFWRRGAVDSFHIYGVTGPDEYTTVVNDNAYTNVMARLNLRNAARAVEFLRRERPDDYLRLIDRLGLTEAEVAAWRRAADFMHVGYDERLGVHPQDDTFLEKEVWDLEHTPAEQFPLLLHYHPLVIYRFQVIKQTDLVLAMLFQGNEFTPDEKRRNFEYYDPLTTGDSSLSAVAQCVLAAEVGYQDLAYRYFTESLYVDLSNRKDNTKDGIHLAAAGGVWTMLAQGFAGFRDYRGQYLFSPRLPEQWNELSFALVLAGERIGVRLRRDELVFDRPAQTGRPIELTVAGERIVLAPGQTTRAALAHQGARLPGKPRLRDHLPQHRPDGTMVTASLPTVPGSLRG